MEKGKGGEKKGSPETIKTWKRSRRRRRRRRRKEIGLQKSGKFDRFILFWSQFTITLTLTQIGRKGTTRGPEGELVHPVGNDCFLGAERSLVALSFLFFCRRRRPPPPPPLPCSTWWLKKKEKKNEEQTHYVFHAKKVRFAIRQCVMGLGIDVKMDICI